MQVVSLDLSSYTGGFGLGVIMGSRSGDAIHPSVDCRVPPTLSAGHRLHDVFSWEKDTWCLTPPKQEPEASALFVPVKLSIYAPLGTSESRHWRDIRWRKKWHTASQINRESKPSIPLTSSGCLCGEVNWAPDSLLLRW